MFLITSRLLRATLPANAPWLGQLLYYGPDCGRDSDWSAIRFRHGRRRLLHVAHSPRHPGLLDAYARSFRCGAIPDIGRADIMAVRVANRDRSRPGWACRPSLSNSRNPNVAQGRFGF